MSKPGSGGLASATNANVDRRERLRSLALETVDLTNDPYFMKNHIGKYECKLCLTLHTNEGSYMAHTQGKRHQENLARRAARLAEQRGNAPLVEKKEDPTQEDDQDRAARLQSGEAKRCRCQPAESAVPDSLPSDREGPGATLPLHVLLRTAS